MSIADRVTTIADFDLAGSLTLESGDFEDYKALSMHHYRAQRPATGTRVLKLVGHERSMLSRISAMRGEDHLAAVDGGKVGGRVSTGRSVSRVCAVLVESMPSLSCMMRDYALSQRYAGIADRRQRAKLLNAEVRCISRVVVHPQWRGLGLAVRLVREALASATTVYTEALAAMGRVNPFFERAGMTAYQRPTHPCDTRLIAAMSRMGLAMSDLSNTTRVLRVIEHRTPQEQAWFERELRRWYAHNGGRSGVKHLEVTSLLQRARERLGLEPVYYLKMNQR